MSYQVCARSLCTEGEILQTGGGYVVRISLYVVLLNSSSSFTLSSEIFFVELTTLRATAIRTMMVLSLSRFLSGTSCRRISRVSFSYMTLLQTLPLVVVPPLPAASGKATLSPVFSRRWLCTDSFAFFIKARSLAC